MPNMAHAFPFGLHLFPKLSVCVYSIISQDIFGITQPHLVPISL